MNERRVYETKARAAAAGAVLAIGLALAGCNNSMQDLNGPANKNAPAIASPDVTAEPVSGGVKLSWPKIDEAAGFQVYRSGGSAAASVQIASVPLDAGASKYVYFDLAGDDNPLTAGTRYTYTVTSSPSDAAQTNGKWTGAVTPTLIPDRGTKTARPNAVHFTLSAIGALVTITPGTGGPASSGYYINLLQKQANGAWDSISAITVTGTTGKIDYPLSGGEYAVRVNGEARGSYYSDSEVVQSEAQVFEILLPGGSYPRVTNISPAISKVNEGDTLHTITGFEANVNLNAIPFKSGVLYKVERAPVGADGVIGDYTEVQLKQWNFASGSYENINFADFLPDFLGHPPASAFGVDTSLPSEARVYQYRIKAVKNGETIYGTNGSESRVR